MATSGSIDFSTTTNEICTEALELLGVLGEGEYPNTEQLASAKRTLNMMAKNWQADGLNLFAMQKTWLFPENGTYEYDLVKPTGAGSTTTTSLTNITTSSDVGTSAIDIVITSASGNNRKVIFAGTNAIVGTPAINGTAGTLVVTASFEGYQTHIYEWLDSELPSTAGTYTITNSSTGQEAGKAAFCADGFTQSAASSTDTDVTEVATNSVTVTPTGSAYLVLSIGHHQDGTDLNAMTLGASQTGILSTGVGSNTVTQVSYSEDSGATHTYSTTTTDTKAVAAASFEIAGVTIGTPLSTRYVKNYYEMTVSTAAASGASTLTMTDNTDLALFEDDDNIGVHLSDNTIQWTTGTLSGTTLTLSDNLTGAVAAGAGVYGYTFSTDAANRPMHILEGYTEQYQGVNEKSTVPVDQLSRVDYYTLNDKNTTGRVNQFYYDPQIGTGKLYIWPTPSDERDVMLLLVQRTLDDFDSQSDSPDYPQEWYMPLAYNLAKHLAPKYGTPQMDYARIVQQAEELYMRAREFDTEMYTSAYFRPEERYDY